MGEKMMPKIPFFELEDDAGDEDRVCLNLINLAREAGTLKRTETDKEIRFEGILSLKGVKDDS